MARGRKRRGPRRDLVVRRVDRDSDEWAAGWELWKEPRERMAARAEAERDERGRLHDTPVRALQKHFNALLAAFHGAEVRYLVAGSYAMTYRPVLRATRNPDLWIDPARENAERVWRGLQKCGVPLDEFEFDDLVDPGSCVRIGEPAHRIALLTALPGTEFARASENPGDRLDLELLEQARDHGHGSESP